MNETTYVYIVHSDINENNIYAEFATEDEAIDYAKRHIDELTYVDRVEASVDDEGDIIEIFDGQTIWIYTDEGKEDIAETEDEYWDRMAQEEADRIDAEACLGDTTWFEDLDTDSLVETLEENEDLVECKECFDLFPKADCIKIEVGYLCPHCHSTHYEDKECIEDEPVVLFDVADEDVFKVDFPELDRMDYGNDMIPDEPNSEPMPEVGPSPDPMAEPCVGPECEAPVEALVTKDETITKLVVDEHEAIDGYDKAKIEIEANSELDEKEKEEILDTIEHIKEEEIEHIEELEELVDEVEETKADEPAEESESEDESEVLVETSVAIPDFKRSQSRKNSHSSYIFDYTAADFEILSHHLNLVYKKATTIPKISAATISYPFKLYFNWTDNVAIAHASKMFTSKLQDCNTLEDIEIKLDPFFDYLGTESEYKNDIEFYDEVVSNFANALWELKTGIPVDKEGLDEKLINNNSDILTEAKWGGFLGIGKASVEDKLDAFFSIADDKKFPYNENYGSNFELKEYNAKTKEFKDLSEADAKYIDLIDNEYEKVGTAKKDAEKLSKSDGARDKYIAVCIKEYKETDTPSIYIYQNGKLKADHSENKIKYFEAKYDNRNKGNSNTSTQTSLEDTNYTFDPAKIEFELGSLLEKEFAILKGGNHISDTKLCATFKFKLTLPKEISNLFTLKPGTSVNKRKLELNKDNLNNITDESVKEKLFTAEGFQLKLIIDGKVKAICTIIIKKETPVETPVEQPVEQPPVETDNTQESTQEQLKLKRAYKTLKNILKKEEVEKYITVKRQGKKIIEYSLAEGKSFDEVMDRVHKAITLGESLTEHVNEEHPAIESDQVLVGTDNAVVDCKVNKVITHSEDEKPVDCKGKKKPLEKPLTESLDEDKLQTMEKYLKSKKWASLEDSWTEEGESYVNEMGAYLDYNHMTNQFVLAISIYHASDDNNAEDPDSHTEEEEYGFDSLAEMYEDEYCASCLDKIYDANEHTLYTFLTEATHAQVAKPEGSRTLAYNNALTYAKKANKPYIYGYTNHTGKFFALDLPLKVTGRPVDSEKEFRSKYKNSRVIYMAYPDKDFITESKFTKAEQEEYNMDENGISLNSYDEFVRCGWCDEIFTKAECVFEKDFGWLCDRCQDELKYHGGHLDIIADPTEEDIERAENNK